MDSSSQNIDIEKSESSISVTTDLKVESSLLPKKKRGRPRKIVNESSSSKQTESPQTKARNKELSFNIKYSSENLFSKFL